MSIQDIIGMNRRNRRLVLPLNRRRDFWVADSKLDSKRWMQSQKLPVTDLIEVVEATSRIRPLLDTLTRESGFVVKPNAGALGNGVKVVSTPFGPDLPVARLRGELYWLMCRILAGEFSGAHAAEIALVEEQIGRAHV